MRRSHHHKTPLNKITATLLLPVVPVVVASASGGIIAEVLPDVDHVVTTLVVSYVLWGLGQTFSFLIMCTYFLRLQLHDLPPREAIVSVLLPIGPLGQGGFGILQLGRVWLAMLPKYGTVGSLGAGGANVGEIFYAVGILAALCMWGSALGWLSFALITFASIKNFPFNIRWWGFTFPLGVCTACTGLLAKELQSPFFKVITMVTSVALSVC